ncbi:MAG: TetR/AcrR family transcriptional regulator [Chloroflexi bacterium]|nr:TetR/AcrR family transcriptional regulator [Chloroflexota bacterium]
MASSKAAQSEATREALLAAARLLFAERGYAGTPTEEIVRRAGVTRGALYHHFRDKQALFEAVYEQVHTEIGRQIVAAAGAAPGPWEKLLAGNQAFLDACLEPAVQRIALIDAPAVLGWDAWRAVEARHGLALLQAGLQTAMDAGALERQPVGPLSHLLLAALSDAAMIIARARDVRATRREMGETVERLLEGLRPARR